MSDAAARFYQRSHEINTRGENIEAIKHEAFNPIGHRYGSAYLYLEGHPGQTVLELGYGSYQMMELMASVSKKLCVIDIVDRLRSITLADNIEMKVGNLDNDFPYPDSSFDTVLAMMVIEHLYDPFHAFAQVARILRKGGRAFVNLPNIASLRCRLQLLKGKLPVTSSNDWFEKREWDGNHLHYFTVAETKRIAELYGLRLVSMAPVGGGLALKKLRPSLFCHEITYDFEKL